VSFKELGLNAKSWPFVEAKKILERIEYKTPKKGYVLFETGYGPSGLPHIGTFGEVARTSMVRYAFSQLSDIPTKLFAFSDDLDGLRKVPTNVPNQERLKQDLGKPLTKVYDPFEKFNSFGEHNNAMLKDFLDRFGFEYEFKSSSEVYKSGQFNEALKLVLKHYDEIMKVMLPTLGEERQETYSPFLPIDKKSGKVLQAKVVGKDLQKNTIIYLDEDNIETEISILDGNCKLQWKADWGMRWYALEVDYEMSGKDLIPSVQLSNKICKILGKQAPINLTYELFLDKNGEKISKSKGNGLSIEEWLTYGNKESLSYFMYQKPQTAKRLYFDVIPKSFDDWLSSLAKYPEMLEGEKVESPLFFIHKNNPPKFNEDLSWGLILNLVAVIKQDNKDVIWGFINKYRKVSEDAKPMIDSLLGYAINYFNDFIKPNLSYKVLNAEEKNLLQLLNKELSLIDEGAQSEDIQRVVYKIGRESGIELKEWFKLLYQSLLGQNEGPRMGSFFKLYGLENSMKLIDQAIQRV
jgi:lysyl-tRNA synthetase class 1